MDLEKIHIGEIIKAKLKEKSMTIQDFADGIAHERTSVYDIFKRKSVDIELLIRISKVLDYDFIHQVYFPDLPNKKMQITIEFDRNEMDKWELLKAMFVASR